MNADQIYSYLSKLKLNLLIGPISDYKKKLFMVTKINTYTLSTSIGKKQQTRKPNGLSAPNKKANLESIPPYLLYHVQQHNF